MIVDLASAPLDTAQDESALAHAGITFVNAQSADSATRSWIRARFSPTWAKEAYHAWNWFAYDKEGELAGFSSYEQRHYRWWWLRNWSAQSDTGIFGPIGVAAPFRNRHLGCVLTRKALASIRALGFARAVIPRVGPVEFYKRCCNAVIADTVRLFGIF
ncbi:MAG: hypothetical protein JO219_10335 [Candidatus Eremiobacteraeota bacterium]|nr:hypothetical protein [Candidatus Eremiobacteraeota bacterium]